MSAFVQIVENLSKGFLNPFSVDHIEELPEKRDMELDFWGNDFWGTKNKPLKADPKQQAPQPVSMGRWMKDHQNGRIPSSALTPLKTQDGHMARRDAAGAFDAMTRAARRDGISLRITDSYRDYATQVRLKAQKGRYAATPGHSNHGWGMAFDIVIDPKVHSWLVKNAASFGFKNPFGNSYTEAFENWHWEFKGGGKGKWAPKKPKPAKVAVVKPGTPGRPARQIKSETLPVVAGPYNDILPTVLWGMMSTEPARKGKPPTKKMVAAKNIKDKGPQAWQDLAPQAIRATREAGVPESWARSPALRRLLRRESSFNPTAQNPTSTAFGLFQFLDGTWAGTGVQKTSNPYWQFVAGFRYIKARYGSPAKAWKFWKENHWY